MFEWIIELLIRLIDNQNNIWVYICVCVYGVCKWVRVCVHTWVRMCVSVKVSMSMCVQTCLHACVCVYTRVRVWMRLCYFCRGKNAFTPFVPGSPKLSDVDATWLVRWKDQISAPKVPLPRLILTKNNQLLTPDPYSSTEWRKV